MIYIAADACVPAHVRSVEAKTVMKKREAMMVKKMPRRRMLKPTIDPQDPLHAPFDYIFNKKTVAEEGEENVEANPYIMRSRDYIK